MDIALSVIIPAYNAKEHIGRALASLLAQGCPELEIIVVDDGSRDGTGDIVREIMASEPEAKVVLHSQRNAGVSAARNVGVDKAKGAYILFLDADDSVSTDLVANLLPLLRENRADVIHWPYDLVDGAGKTLLAFPYSDAPAKRDGIATLQAILLEQVRIWTGSAAYRQVFLREHGLRFTVGCTAGEDIEFIYRALSYAESVAFTGDPRSFYVQHPASVMHRHSIGKLTAVTALERLRDDFMDRKTPKLTEIAKRLNAFDIPHSYAGTYTMCLRHMMGAEGMGYRAARKQLRQEIEERFPGMAGRMDALITGRKRGLLPDRLDIFHSFPWLYLMLSNFRQMQEGQV